MTTIVRFNEDDLRKLVARELQVPEEKLTSVYTEEMRGYGQGEHTVPVFYIEYEKGRIKMNGIKMSDCKFYVDDAARTVVCVIPNKIYHKDGSITVVSAMLDNFIEEHFRFNDIDFNFGLNYSWQEKNLEMPHSFMGKAVCAPEDEWNEEVGRMIAFTRAKDKCYKSFFKRANRLIQAIDKRLNDMITTFNDFGMRLEAKHEALQTQINEKIGKEE